MTVCGTMDSNLGTVSMTSLNSEMTSSEVDDVNALLRNLGVDELSGNGEDNKNEIKGLKDDKEIENNAEGFTESVENLNDNMGIAKDDCVSNSSKINCISKNKFANNRNRILKSSQSLCENTALSTNSKVTKSCSSLAAIPDEYLRLTPPSFKSKTPSFPLDLDNIECDVKTKGLTKTRRAVKHCGQCKITSLYSKLHSPKLLKEVSKDVLYSGIISLTGCHDVKHWPLLHINCMISKTRDYDVTDIAKALLYFTLNMQNLTVIMELSTDCCVNNHILEALLWFQNSTSNNFRVVFYSPDNVEMSWLPVKNFNIQCEFVNEFDDLLRICTLDCIPSRLGGHLLFNYDSWVDLKKKTDQCILSMESATHRFTSGCVALETSLLPDTIEQSCVELLIHRENIKQTLQKSFAVEVDQLKTELLAAMLNEDNTNAQKDIDLIESTQASLRNAINRYVLLYDTRVLVLERHLLVARIKLFCQQILQWSTEQRLQVIAEYRFMALTPPALRRQRAKFDKLYLTCALFYTKCENILLDASRLIEAGLLSTVQSRVTLAKEYLGKLIDKMEEKKEEIETVSNLYRFVDKAYSWALNGMKFVASLSMNDCVSAEACQTQINKFDEYMSLHPPIKQEEFIAMQALAQKFGNIACEKQCEISLHKCQETEILFSRRRALLEKARDHLKASIKKRTSFRQSLKNHGRLNATNSSEKSNSIVSPSLKSMDSETISECSEIQSEKTEPTKSTTPVEDRLSETGDVNTSAMPGEGARSKHRPRKLLRKSASMCCSRPTLLIGSPMMNSQLNLNGKSKSSLAIEELIYTEHEYVQSLRYIVEHYLPEMNRLDVPQSLRGKRGVIFGNIENITDFHSGKFLDELKTCSEDPLKVAQTFLNHKESFGLYALYSKNKPRSDVIMSDQGMKFFKVKQRQLEDKMDLASYLLKPVQRMGKYALLLHNICKHSVDPTHQEALNEAEKMVKFQLRHGNDLLAMDSIVDCDINVKEQGELLRQDQFIAFAGRKKLLRHVFLFTDVIVLCKPIHVHGGHDTYIYKHSFKTSEIGLTENIGDAGVKFEIWMRRHRNSSQSFVLQCSSRKLKEVWVGEIRQLLWKQALKNKENRRMEMLSMGVGSKPFLDLQSSDNPITERSVSVIKNNVLHSRTRNSIAVSNFDNVHKRPHSVVSTSSTSSNSSLVPSLNLASQQPNSYLDFQAILEDAESESDSARSSSFTASHTSHEDPSLDNEVILPTASQTKTPQTFPTACLVK